MRTRESPRSRGLTALALGLVCAQAASAAFERTETENFQILYDPSVVSVGAVEFARSTAERDFARVSAFLGAERVVDF